MKDRDTGSEKETKIKRGDRHRKIDTETERQIETEGETEKRNTDRDE